MFAWTQTWMTVCEHQLKLNFGSWSGSSSVTACGGSQPYNCHTMTHRTPVGGVMETNTPRKKIDIKMIQWEYTQGTGSMRVCFYLILFSGFGSPQSPFWRGCLWRAGTLQTAGGRWPDWWSSLGGNTQTDREPQAEGLYYTWHDSLDILHNHDSFFSIHLLSARRVKTFIYWQGEDVNSSTTALGTLNPSLSMQILKPGQGVKLLKVNQEITVKTQSPKSPTKVQHLDNRRRQNTREHSLKPSDSLRMTTRLLQLSFDAFQLQLSYIILKTEPGPSNTVRAGLCN